MDIRPLPADEDAVRHHVAALWIPYHRDLEAAVDRHALADDVDLVEEEVDFRLERLSSENYRAWVAVDAAGPDEPAARGGAGGGVTTDDAAGHATDDAPAPATDDATGLATDDATPLTTDDEALVGFVTTEVDEAPSVFERPDRLVVGDLYVSDPYRGTGLARDLVERAAERARAAGCAELVLDVAVDNERALAFYRKLGFEPRRHRMSVDAGDL